MKVCVVYESMYGNTHQIAEAIAEGLQALGEVTVGSVAEFSPESGAQADLIVVGGPTHMHGMSRAGSRKAAAETAATDEAIDLEPDAVGSGVRDWLAELPKRSGVFAAAFDTRIDKAMVLTGSAAKGIEKELKRHRLHTLDDPASFLVEGSEGPLKDGEIDRARAWGHDLVERYQLSVART
jgi:flavodoxin